MLSVGDTAPEFELPGTAGDEIRTYRLSEFLEGGLLLSFYTFDFSPSCSVEVCGLRDTEWFTIVDGLDVVAVSTDGPYAHMEFIDQYNLDFPLLSDSDAAVAAEYGSVHQDWKGFDRVIQRSTFLIDDDRRIRHVTATADPLADPQLDPVRRAVRDLYQTP